MSKDAKQYVKKGLITQSDFDFLAELDPSKTKKYLLFIVKSYLSDTDLDLLRNRITEYDILLNRNKVDRKDINSFKSFRQLDEYVQKINNTRSNRELKRDIKKEADIILNNDDLFIVSPHCHKASQLYGAGTRWCITSKRSTLWEFYYYDNCISFYFVQVRSDELKKNLKEDLHKVAVAVYPNAKLDLYDAADHLIGYRHEQTEKAKLQDDYFKTLCLDKSLFVPRSLDERMNDLLSYKLQECVEDLDFSKMGITKIPEAIGNMVQLKSLILSENKIQTLPETIGKLTNLKTLYLFHNHLTSLPQSIEKLIGLEWLGLSGNMIPKKVIKELKKKLPETRIYIEK